MSPEPSQRAKDCVASVWNATFAGQTADEARTELTKRIQAALDAERAEMASKLGWTERSVEHLEQRIEAMAALLDASPHMQVPIEGKWTCVPKCPACAWQKLKASSE